MSYKDPKPEIQRIEEIVTGVINGDIRLPRFQRPFVWKRKEIIKLLDSIYRGYPIGSILLWHTSEKLNSERTIGDLDIHSQEFYPTNYLLDGQQRITSLCGTLYWNGNDVNSIWNVAFDLDKEEFIHPYDDNKIEYFPLNKLLNTSDFITRCKAFEAHGKKEKLFKNAEKLLRTIKDYKIAAVRIGEMTIEEVAPIFERINSTGRKLTIVDLMRAATWKGGFDLNDALNKVRIICEALSYNSIPDNHILRNISSCSGLGINREDVDKLRHKSAEELETASIKCAMAYEAAINFLKSNFPLPTYEYLPYGLQLTFLVEFFNLSTNPTDEQLNNLKKWFWITAFTRHFGASNSGQNAKDLDNIRKFARSEIDTIPIDRDILIDRFVFDDFRLNIANSKTFVLLLASKSPLNLYTGELINTAEALSVVNRYEFKHVVPVNAYAGRNLNICANIVFMNINLFNYAISRNVADYINFDVTLSLTNNEAILASNLLDSDCINALLHNDVEGFLAARKDIIIREIEALTGKKTIPRTLLPVKYDFDLQESDDDE